MNRPLSVFCAALVALSGSSPLRASESVSTGEVLVNATEPNAAFEQAMRIALVRITGSRDAAQDPALAPLIASARRYVQIYRPAAAGSGTQVTLDAAAIERVVMAAGRGVWPKERPSVLLILPEAQTGADAASLRRALEDAASQRGLPLVLSSAAAAGIAAGVEATTAMAVARRLGADAALLGQPDPNDSAGWSWTFYGAGGREDFTGGLTSGIDNVADRLAATTQAAVQQPSQETLVRIAGVGSLRDYAEVSRLLTGAAGVRSVALIEAGNGGAVYRVSVRGGGDGLAVTLASSARLRPTTDASGRVAYQFQP